MQNIFRLPWCTDSGTEKPEKAMFSKMCHPPVVDISLLGKVKRKRSESPSFDTRPAVDHAKRRKLSSADNSLSLPGTRQSDVPTDLKISYPELCDSANYGLQNSMAKIPLLAPDMSFAAPGPNATAPGSNARAPTPSPSAKPNQPSESNDKPEILEANNEPQLQDVLEHQFNLEILLKHRELRLIEQELAKCQTALEQLRRCELIPYPGASGLSESLSSGTGPAIQPQSGFTQPQAPSPWGVTDGPYTRHYARWLLSDPTFDSLPLNYVMPTSESHATQPEGRSTRNSGAGIGRTGRSRSSRDSFGNVNQALHNDASQSRGKQGGPLVIRRLADNLFVKLICNNCQRGNFSSVQGFLNHCRIAHKVDYKSHEAAALDCGKPLEEDETHLIPQGAPAMIPGAPKQQQVHKPVTTQATSSTPVGFVHPLNAPVLPRFTWKVQAEEARSSVSQSQSRRAVVSQPSTSSAATSFHASPLVGSPSAPYLSARFAKRGLGGDLQRATAQAREKVDLGPDPVEDEHVTTTSETPQSNGTSAQDGSQSNKGWYAPTSRARPAPIMARHVEMMDSPPSLSPHAVDSNPGLVSDHEDDDTPSDLEDVGLERHQSPGAVNGLGSLRGRTCGEGMDVDLEVDVEEEADGHSVLIRPRSLGLQMRSSGSPSRDK